MCEKYNGYTNYETWNAALWIDNDQGEQEYWLEQAKDSDKIWELAESMKDYHQEFANEVIPETGFFSDIFQHSLEQVNWYEIAENMIEYANE